MHLHDHQHKRRWLDHGLDLNNITCMYVMHQQTLAWCTSSSAFQKHGLPL